MSFRVLSSILLSRFLGADVMHSGLSLWWRLSLKLIISSWYALIVLARYCKFVWCWMLQASRSMFFSRSLGANCLLDFRWPFYSRVWVEPTSKDFDGQDCWLDEKKKKKKYLLNCKYKVTFQPDRCTDRTRAATCFIHFGFGHRLDNIRLLKCTFVVFYSFLRVS